MTDRVSHRSHASGAFLAALALFAVIASGCTVGYRYTRHDYTFQRDDGREIEISGPGHNLRLGAVFDFRYFRLGIPFEANYRHLRFMDENGNDDRDELIRERRLWRLDVPVFSVWDIKDGGVGYPGKMRHRESLEIWLGAESDFMKLHEWWFDIGLAYYRYNGVGTRLYFGAGSAPFRATTRMPGSLNPYVWEGNSPMFGFGLEGTFTAGEFALDAIEYLLGMDKRHRDRSRRYGWD